MNCESVRKQFPLYLYGELSFEDEETVAGHLDDCAGCREQLEREKRMQSALDGARVTPSADLLERCRLELPRTIRDAGAVPGGRAGWLRRLLSPGIPSPGWLRPLGAVALLAVGFFAARYTAPGTGGPTAAPESVATRVRYVEPAGPGKVRIVFDETRQRELSGSVDDGPVRQMLLAAMQNPVDPGLRAESLDLLKGRSESRDVRAALLLALENDPNDGVRLKALEGLRPYSAAPETRRALSRVLLADDNPGIRSMAINLLVESNSTDVVETLQELLQTEKNGYIRNRTQQALEDMNASVETF